MDDEMDFQPDQTFRVAHMRIFVYILCLFWPRASACSPAVQRWMENLWMQVTICSKWWSYKYNQTSAYMAHYHCYVCFGGFDAADVSSSSSSSSFSSFLFPLSSFFLLLLSSSFFHFDDIVTINQWLSSEVQFYFFLQKKKKKLSNLNTTGSQGNGSAILSMQGV